MQKTVALDYHEKNIKGGVNPPPPQLGAGLTAFSEILWNDEKTMSAKLERNRFRKVI